MTAPMNWLLMILPNAYDIFSENADDVSIVEHLGHPVKGLEVTDDVSIVEHLGHPVFITEGSYTNIKIVKGHLPLLSNSCDGGGESSFGTVNSDDELSTNFGELNLEGLSRLDGRRWSASYRSQDSSDFIAASGEGEEESSSENIRSLSQRYRPIFFDELIGKNIVVQSLMNSISKGRVAPVYLFPGPRGTGKTSSAKIVAAVWPLRNKTLWNL
uniref:Uncharacterized protein n=1 Tax=Chenopodium quinoa TaxID=63459 RepID=A0A803LSR6_CHEQI